MSEISNSLGGRIKAFPKGAILYREGDNDAQMYVILKGSVELSRTIGGKKSFRTVTPGQFFGEMSLLDGEQRCATAITDSDSLLMIIDQKNFDEVIAKNPHLALHIITKLAMRIRILKNSLKKATAGSAETEKNCGELENRLEVSTATAPKENGTSNHEIATAESDSNQPLITLGDLNHTLNLDSSDDTTELDNLESQITPELLKHYCFPKELTCPVCDTKFQVAMLRDSKLKLKERTDELRNICEDIEPLIYNIWVCPHCFYSMKKTEFSALNEIQKRNLSNQLVQRKNSTKLDFTKSSTYGFVLKAYKLSIDCCNCLGKKNVEDRIAELWMNIAWLYDDLGQQENALEARKQALAKFKNSYSFGTDRTDGQDQKIEYLIGKLSAVFGNMKEAKDFLFKIVCRRNSHPLLKKMAQDGLEQLKNS